MTPLQSTQPATQAALVVATDPSYPAWVNALIGACMAVAGVLGALALLMPVLRGFLKDVREMLKDVRKEVADVGRTAAEAKGATDAIQQSMTRVSARQNETAKIVTDVALKVDPKANPPVE